MKANKSSLHQLERSFKSLRQLRGVVLMVSGGNTQSDGVGYVVIPAVVVTNDEHHQVEIEDLLNKEKPGSYWRGGELDNG